MAVKTDYETRPFSDEVWAWMKRIRRNHFLETWQAQKEGGICATGINLVGNLNLLAGFGTVANPSVASGYTRIARRGTAEDGLKQYVDVAEAKGYSPLCGAIGLKKPTATPPLATDATTKRAADKAPRPRDFHHSTSS